MNCRLYLISPPVIPEPEAFAQGLAAALDAGDVAAFQIRLKDAPDDHLRAVTRAVQPVCHAHGVAVIMNDRVDLARELGCDGVHLGQSDMPLKQARALLGRGAMIGITCHDSRHLAMEAAEAGADYVAFGAFFATSTKETLHTPDLDILRIWQDTMEVPCVAIGGITAETARAIAEAGADFIAVSGAVWNHPDNPAVGVRALLSAMSV